MLDEREDVSYPDSTQLSDGTIVVSYDRQRGELGEILVARFTESDLRSSTHDRAAPPELINTTVAKRARRRTTG